MTHFCTNSPKIAVLFVVMSPDFEKTFLTAPFCRYELILSEPKTEFPPKLADRALEIDFLDLNGLLNHTENSDKALVEWAKFLLPKSMDEWQKTLKSNPNFKNIGEKVMGYQRDGEILTEAQLIQNEIEFQLAALENKYSEGKAEGKLEGKAEGKAEGELEKSKSIARKLLQNRHSPAQIADITELSLEEIQNLLN